MAEDKEGGIKGPVPAPATATPANRDVQYVGPKPAPRIKIPGDSNTYSANTLTPAQREFVLRTVPDAKGWWR